VEEVRGPSWESYIIPWRYFSSYADQTEFRECCTDPEELKVFTISAPNPKPQYMNKLVLFLVNARSNSKRNLNRSPFEIREPLQRVVVLSCEPLLCAIMCRYTRRDCRALLCGEILYHFKVIISPEMCSFLLESFQLIF